jgi:hypothetical protein
MTGENRQLVTDELVEFKKYRLKFKASWELPITLDEYINIPQINIEKPKDVNM